MTYELGGEQYVAIGPRDGDAVWAFKLGGRIRPLNPPPLPPTELPFTGPVSRSATITIDVAVRERDTDRLEGTSIDDYATFQPTRAGAAQGATITWKNEGRMPHTATVRGLNLTTGVIPPGESGSITFEKPGTYVYSCLFHPWRSGQIIVDAKEAVLRD